MSNRKSSKSKPSAGRRKVIAALLTLGILGVGAFTLLTPSEDPRILPATPRIPRPKTLSPSLFTGKTAQAYRVAWEHPELLERMPCYCGCYLDEGHQNNLDCFIDKHASA